MHPYLTFHAKENGTETRHVYFKELRLTTLGSSQVEPVYEDLVPSTGRQIYQDASYFIMPRCPVALPGGGGIGG